MVHAIADSVQRTEPGLPNQPMKTGTLFLGFLPALVIALIFSILAGNRDHLGAESNISLTSSRESWPWTAFGKGKGAPLKLSMRAFDIGDRLTLQLASGHVDKFPYFLEVTTFALSGDHRHVYTAGGDGTVRLWRLHDGKELRVYRINLTEMVYGRPKRVSPGVVCLAVSVDGKKMITGHSTGTGALWDLDTGRVLRSFERPSQAAFSTGPSTALTAVAISEDGKKLAITSSDGIVRFWNMAVTPEQKRTISDVSSGGVSLAHGGQLLVVGANNEVHVWDTNTGAKISDFKGHNDSVNAVSVSPDGKWLATASSDRTASIWNLTTGKKHRNLVGHDSIVRSVAWSADAGWLATGSNDGTARLWEINSGLEVAKFGGYKGAVSTVALTRDRMSMLTSSTFRSDTLMNKLVYDTEPVRIWRLPDFKESCRLRGLTKRVWSINLSPTGQSIATMDVQKIHLWDLRAGKQVAVVDCNTDRGLVVAVNCQNDWYAAGDADGWVRIVELPNGKESRRFRAQSDDIVSIAISADGQAVFTGSKESIRMSNARTGLCLQTFPAPNLKKLIQSSIIVSPGKRWLSIGLRLQPLKIWDVQTGQVANALAEGGEPLAFSRDDEWLIATELSNHRTSVSIWNVKTGKKRTALAGVEGVVTAVFSNDAKWVVTGGNDGSVVLWDAATGARMREFEGQFGSVDALALGADNKVLFTASEDGTSSVWDVATGKNLCQIVSFADETWAVIDRQYRYDASNSDGIDGLYWVVGGEYFPLGALKDQYYTPALLAECLRLSSKGQKGLP